MREINFKKADTVRVIAELASYIDSLDNDKDYTLTVDEHKVKRKRSLNANSYAWTLIDQLAEVLREPKTEVYRRQIREMGGNNYLVCCIEEAAENFCKDWESHGIGWLAEYEPSKLDGCINIRAYYGSSEYDSKQMSRLIELVVQECKQQGIETLTPAELARLSEDWGR